MLVIAIIGHLPRGLAKGRIITVTCDVIGCTEVNEIGSADSSPVGLSNAVLY